MGCFNTNHLICVQIGALGCTLIFKRVGATLVSLDVAKCLKCITYVHVDPLIHLQTSWISKASRTRG